MDCRRRLRAPELALSSGSFPQAPEVDRVAQSFHGPNGMLPFRARGSSKKYAERPNAVKLRLRHPSLSFRLNLKRHCHSRDIPTMVPKTRVGGFQLLGRKVVIFTEGKGAAVAGVAAELEVAQFQGR